MLFERLRSETRDLHEQIERRLPVFRPDFTRRDYLDLLCRYLAFYRPVEAGLAGLRSSGLSMFTEDRRKCPLLLQDLQWLTASVDNAADGLNTEVKAIPPLQSVSQGIGCMYVLEGSTLGGQIISRHLKQKLGVAPDRGGSFFASYRDELARRWNEFRAAVCAENRTQTDMDEIIASARATFECFDAWLGQVPT